jgi:hypothetical protein
VLRQAGHDRDVDERGGAVLLRSRGRELKPAAAFYDGPPRIAGGGDMARITCSYDTTKDGQPITWGEGTDDEMCLAFLYVSPY